MKKLLIIITLFVSSFFFISLKEVDAASYNYVKEIDFTMMQDVPLLIEKLDAFVKNDTTYSDNYFIYYKNNTLYYYILPLDWTYKTFQFYYSSSILRLTYMSTIHFGTSLSVINFSGSGSNQQFFVHNTASAYINGGIVYSNFDFINDMNTITITYNSGNFGYTYTFSGGERIKTLYDIYQIYREENSYPKEIDKVTNFYNIVIEKISYLAEQVSSNYTLLSIIVIFIIIFIFLLIFRRFL